MLNKLYSEYQTQKADNESQDTSAISHEEHQSLSNSPHHSSNSSNYNLKIKSKKRNDNICYTLNLLKKNENIHISFNEYKTYFSKIRLKTFDDDNYQKLLEKGKKNLDEFFKLDISMCSQLTYWNQRYYYYSKYDEGILMDKECWWSVTPEIIAEYIAKIAGKDSVVIDGFCGSGGNVIQFSKFCKKVYAIDIDKKKLDYCQNNCKVYNCENNIEFILSDFLKMENSPIFSKKADFIFLSPPWGGSKYKNSDVYCIKKLMSPNIYDIIRVSLNVSKKIMFYLPRTLLLDELFDILSDVLEKNKPGSGDRIFFDVHILQSSYKIKAQLIIFGYDINNEINENDLTEYLNSKYENISDKSLKILIAISKIIGNFKFLQSENYFRKNYINYDDDDDDGDHRPNELFKYFYGQILTDQEKIKLKSLNLLSIKSKKKRDNFNQNKNKKNIHLKTSNLKLNKSLIKNTCDNNNICIKLKTKDDKNEKNIIMIYNNLKINNKNFSNQKNYVTNYKITNKSRKGYYTLEKINQITLEFIIKK